VLSLVLHGKLAVTEDVLTAAVFDAIQETQDLALVRALLAGARGLHGGVSVAAFDGFEVELWPWTDAGEPDVRIVLRAGGAHVGTVLVEAKLGASKHGEGVALIDEEAPVLRDQLARYLRAEVDRDPTTVLVYLTHHGVIPDADLRESIDCLPRLGRPELADRLHWLPWRELERAMAARIAEGAPHARVRQILRRVRMYWFDGMPLVPAPPRMTTAPGFYRRRTPADGPVVSPVPAVAAAGPFPAPA
jgi:hypothetical protein